MTTGQLYEAYHFIVSDVNPAEIAFTKIMSMMCYVGRLLYVSYACSRTSNEVIYQEGVGVKIQRFLFSTGESHIFNYSRDASAAGVQQCHPPGMNCILVHSTSS